MNKLGSYFLDDFEPTDKPFLFGMTLRHLVLFTVMGLVVVSMGLIFFFELPDLLAYLIGGIFLPPTVGWGLSLDRKFQVQEKLRFFLMIQERTYQTEYRKDREYQTHDFIQEKGVKETDDF